MCPPLSIRMGTGRLLSILVVRHFFFSKMQMRHAGYFLPDLPLICALAETRSRAVPNRTLPLV